MEALARKRCFVVSPIGVEGSSIRSDADDVFDLVVEPAVAPFDFEVIRADKIAGPGPITTEIVDLVQNAELCVVDLTGKNANVFYECGRRHETGKPFVQLARRGEDLPFDVAGIRTIFYDLSTPRSVKEAGDQLQRFVAEFAQAGFSASAGSSLSTVASALERVENKVDRLLAAPGPGRSGRRQRRRGRFPVLVNPREAFIEAVMEGDAAEAELQIPRLKEMIGASSAEFIAAAGTLADAGSIVGANELHEIIGTDESVADLDPANLRAVLSSLVQYYSGRDQEHEGIERLSGLFGRLMDEPNRSDEDKGFIINQLQRLCYGGSRYEEAQRYGEQAIRLNPSEPSYHFNLSLVYETRGLLDLAEREVDEFMKSERSQSEPDYLAQAIKIYVKRGRLEDGRRAYATLTSIDEGTRRSLRLMMDEEIQQLLAPPM